MNGGERRGTNSNQPDSSVIWLSPDKHVSFDGGVCAKLIWWSFIGGRNYFASCCLKGVDASNDLQEEIISRRRFTELKPEMAPMDTCIQIITEVKH